jgi:cytosine/adenosine deaminase-related metal-dependent hydrolase
MIITASKLLTLQNGMTPLDNGAVVLGNGVISAVGTVRAIIKKYPGRRVHHVEDAVLMPGLVNVHAHLELPPLLNRTRAESFPDWIMSLIQAKKDLDTRDYSNAARDNIDTLIQTGVTSVGEICTHKMSPALLRQSGLRAVIFYEIISMVHSFPFAHLSSLFSRPSSLIQFGLSPHSPYTVSDSTLLQIKDEVEERTLKLSMHIAESKDEIRLLQRKKSGLEKLYRLVGWDKAWAPAADSPFEYLKRLGLLSPIFLAVHAVQVTDGDIRILKKSGTPVAHCPRSNKETGVGKMPLKKLLNAGICVGLGTDSKASSPSLSMWDEMRYALRIHRRDGITARDIFRLATIGGAKALGLDKETGSLAVGKRADIIAVPLPKKNTGDLYSDLLRETKSCIINMVDGKILFKDNTL